MTFSSGKPPCTCSSERTYLMLIYGRHYEGCRVIRKWPSAGVPLLVLALFGMPAFGAVGPLEPIPAGLEDAVRTIDSALPRSNAGTRDYISDLLHLAKRGQASALDRLRDIPNGVLCFWLDHLLTFAQGAASDGARLGSTVERLTKLYGENCRGPGGKAAEEESTRVMLMFAGALNELRVAEAVARMLAGTPYRHLSPQTMRALPAGPPVPGAPNAQMVLAALIVALSAGVATPIAAGAVTGEALTWPGLAAAMAGAQ